MRIRMAQAGEEDSLKRIMRASIRAECATIYGLETVKAWTADGNSRFDFRISARAFVAEENGRLLAFSGWRTDDVVQSQRARISAVFVTPDNVRRGLGRSLLRRTLDDIRDNGFDEAYLMSSLNAVAFYRAMGFEGGAKEAMIVAEGYHVAIRRMTRSLIDDEVRRVA